MHVLEPRVALCFDIRFRQRAPFRKVDRRSTAFSYTIGLAPNAIDMGDLDRPFDENYVKAVALNNL
jgi:hypothetical protein